MEIEILSFFDILSLLLNEFLVDIWIFSLHEFSMNKLVDAWIVYFVLQLYKSLLEPSEKLFLIFYALNKSYQII